MPYFLIQECAPGSRKYCVTGGFETDLNASGGTYIRLGKLLTGCWTRLHLDINCHAGFTPITLPARYCLITVYSTCESCKSFVQDPCNGDLAVLKITSNCCLPLCSFPTDSGQCNDSSGNRYGFIGAAVTGGSASYTYSVTGPNGYSYSGIGTFQLDAVGADITISGVYRYIVYDKNGLSGCADIFYTAPDPVKASMVNVIQPTCNTGSRVDYSLSGSSQTLYDYTITEQTRGLIQTGSVNAQGGVISNLPPGVYTFTFCAQLPNGTSFCQGTCTDSFTVTINSPQGCDPCYLLHFCDGSHDVLITLPSFSGPLGIDPNSYVGRCFKALATPPGSPPISEGCYCLSYLDTCPNPVSGYTVIIDTLYNSCLDCSPKPCWKLTNCINSLDYYLVTTDLTSLNGSVINHIAIEGSPDPVIDPLTCFIVTKSDPCNTSLILESHSVPFPDCECCISPVPTPEPSIPRVIPEPVKHFTQITIPECDIRNIELFATAYYNLFKTLKYGITSCCTSYDLEAVWLSNELTSLSLLNVPSVVCKLPPHKDICYRNGH